MSHSLSLVPSWDAPRSSWATGTRSQWRLPLAASEKYLRAVGARRSKKREGEWTTELQSPLPPLRETSLPKHTLDFYKSSNNSFTRSDRPFMKPSDMQPLTMARFITHQSQEFLGLNQSPYE